MNITKPVIFNVCKKAVFTGIIWAIMRMLFKFANIQMPPNF